MWVYQVNDKGPVFSSYDRAYDCLKKIVTYPEEDLLVVRSQLINRRQPELGLINWYPERYFISKIKVNP